METTYTFGLDSSLGANETSTTVMDEDNPRVSDVDIVVWYTFSIGAALVLLAVIIILIMQYFRASCKMPQSKKFILFFVMCLCFWLIEAVATISNVVRVHTTAADKTSIHETADWILFLPRASYNIARAIMLFYFVIKSYIVFKDSAYAVSRRFVWALFVCTLVAFMLQVVPLIYHIVDDTVSGDKWVFLTVGWGIDFVVSIMALWKFVHILFQLTLSGIHRYEAKQEQSSAVELDEHQTKVMSMITRTTVLSLLALLSSVVFGFVFNPLPGLLTYRIAVKLSGNHFNVAAMCDSAFNAVCMYLSYAFSTKQYSWCCHKCDRAMYDVCLWYTGRALKKQSKTTTKTDVTEKPADTEYKARPLETNV